MMDNLIWEKRREDAVERPNDVRNAWERDLARLIHSSAFRRLQAKTQVLGLGESDFYRTRLTHSMEVAQIGSGILKFLKQEYNSHEVSEFFPDAQLMSSICLAHDIGHPPFGHGGEVALNHCMRKFGGFEGNGQTLRILSKLDKYTESFGLNPTRRMLLGVLKYPVNYSALIIDGVYEETTETDKPKWLFKAESQKPPKCFHDEEQDVVNFVFEPFCTSDISLFQTHKVEEDGKHSKPQFKGLDTTIMELADDISYSLHDFEDAISLGMITKEKWTLHFSDKSELFSHCSEGGFLETSETLANKLFKASHDRKNCIGSLVNAMVTNTEIYERESNFKHGILRYNARLKPNFDKLRKAIFKLVKQEVILHENVQQLEFKGQKLIVELFEVLSTDPERFLPKATKERWNKAQDDCQKVRVICDFVAGMTDDYATRLYEKIFFPRLGSIFDRL